MLRTCVFDLGASGSDRNHCSTAIVFTSISLWSCHLGRIHFRRTVMYEHLVECRSGNSSARYLSIKEPTVTGTAPALSGFNWRRNASTALNASDMVGN